MTLTVSGTASSCFAGVKRNPTNHVVDTEDGIVFLQMENQTAVPGHDPRSSCETNTKISHMGNRYCEECSSFLTRDSLSLLLEISMRFQIQTLIFATTIAAILSAWYLDHRSLQQDAKIAIEAKNHLEIQRIGNTLKFAHEKKVRKFLMQSQKVMHEKQVQLILEQMRSRSAGQVPSELSEP